MAKKWQKSVKKCCGEAGSPGSPGQGRGDFFLARGIMFPGFPALGPGGDIVASHGSTKWLLTTPLFGCVVVVAVGAWDIPAQGCTYEISEKKEVSIWPGFSHLAKYISPLTQSARLLAIFPLAIYCLTVY